jgi:hypothetical protein
VSRVGDLSRTMRGGIALFAKAISGGVQNQVLLDVAHIGNTGNAYPWTPALIADVDMWCLVKDFSPTIGGWLRESNEQVARALAKRGIKLEVRAIDGPYKPVRTLEEPPILFGHLLLDTSDTYLRRNSLTRWAWRKYECLVVPSRLRELASLPSVNDLLSAEWGIDDCISKLTRESVTMPEWQLPDLVRTSETITVRNPRFLEFAFYAATTCARNHARVLRFLEPDQLPNQEFFLWYDNNVLRSTELMWIVRTKQLVREGLTTVSAKEAQSISLTFLHCLRTRLIADL